jgi:hypothetical protein
MLAAFGKVGKSPCRQSEPKGKRRRGIMGGGRVTSFSRRLRPLRRHSPSGRLLQVNAQPCRDFGERISFCIFIASTTTIPCPASTASPIFISTSTILPGIGAGYLLRLPSASAPATRSRLPSAGSCESSTSYSRPATVTRSWESLWGLHARFKRFPSDQNVSRCLATLPQHLRIKLASINSPTCAFTAVNQFNAAQFSV